MARNSESASRLPSFFLTYFSPSKRQRQGDPLNRGDDDCGVASVEICSLLEDAYFLERVLLQCPVETLRSCRRVCRKWREASKRLPLVLSTHHWWNTTEILKRFPGAAFMSIQLPESERPENAFQKLARARNLESLKLRSWKPWTNMKSVSKHLCALKRLKSLSLEWCNEERGLDMFASLGALVSLTSLTVRSVVGNLSDLKYLEALTQMKRLELQFLFVENPEEHIRLPLVASVTHLSIGTTYAAGIGSGIDTLKMIESYTATLRSLCLSEVNMLGPFQDFSILRSFRKLQHLSFRCSYSDVELKERTYFFDAIRKMKNLTNLELSTSACLSPAVFHAVSQISKLQRLSYQPQLMDPNSFPIPRLSTLSQLSHLSLRSAPVGLSLDGLTGLVELSIQNCAQNVVDLDAALRRMLCLEKLSLGFDDSTNFAISNSVLFSLKHLRSVQLCGATIKEDA